jgi:Myo-inositol oxygenase
MFVINSFISCMSSKYDLYSKSKVRVNVEEVKPYYMSLINKV